MHNLFLNKKKTGRSLLFGFLMALFMPFMFAIKSVDEEGGGSTDEQKLAKELKQKIEEGIRKSLEQSIDKFQAGLMSEAKFAEKMAKLGLEEKSIENLTKAIELQGLELKKLSDIKTKNPNQLGEAFQAKLEDIKSLPNRKGQMVDIYTQKAVADITVANGTLASALSPLFGVLNSDELNAIRLRMPFIEDYATVTSSAKGVFAYTDFKPKEGDVAIVLEGAEKPQLDFTWVTTPLTPTKVAGYVVLSDEALTDVPQLQGIAESYLLQKYLLKRQSIIIDYVISVAPAFVAGTWTGDKKTLPNLYDAIVAASNQIQIAANHTDDVEYLPNVVYLNPADMNALRIKQDDRNYVFPQLNQVAEGTLVGIKVIASTKIPVGKILIGDFSKLNIVNYVNYAVSVGWINDQFIHNMITMVGEGRFYTYIRTLDTLAFIYDDIANVLAGIEEVQA
jgi:hypothetical protein